MIQHRAGKEYVVYNDAVDAWSCGVIGYEILNPAHFNVCATMVNYSDANRLEYHTDLRSGCSSLPESENLSEGVLRGLIRRMLSDVSHERPPASAVLQALRNPTRAPNFQGAPGPSSLK